MSQDLKAQTEIRTEADGSWKRKDSVFRDWIKKGSGKFEPEAGRYHLYVQYGCPWATRTLIVRKLKGLEDLISVTVVSPRTTGNGWAFASVDPFPGTEDDPSPIHAKYLKDLYFSVDPDYSGRFTVPVLWDKVNQTIVNNESSEIIRMLNSEFNHLLPEGEKKNLDLYPEALRKDIDELNGWILPNINNGVYRAGFASSQEAYSKAVQDVFDGLDRVEKILATPGQKYLLGDKLTEADVRLWVTAIRFDVAYVVRFKCNIRDIRTGYPSINRWMKELYWSKETDAFRSSTNFEHIKTGYFSNHIQNAQPQARIIPVGPKPEIEPLE